MAPANKVRITWTSHASLREGEVCDSQAIADAYLAVCPDGFVEVPAGDGTNSTYSGNFVIDTVTVVD